MTTHRTTPEQASLYAPAGHLAAPARIGPHTRTAIACLAVCIIALLFGAPSLLEPFGRDQAEYATIADASLRGQVIYRDLFNVKPPLTHMVHELALVLFGHAMMSIRLLDLVWNMLTAIVLWLIGKRLQGGNLPGVLAAAVYSWGYAELHYASLSQTDGFLTLFAALGVLAYLHAQTRLNPWFIFTSGMSIAVAALFKYPIGILVVFLGVLLLIKHRMAGIRAVCVLVAGFAMPIAACMLILLYQGALPAFLDIQLNYIPQYNIQSVKDVPYLVAALGGILVFSWRHVLFSGLSVIGLLGFWVSQRSAQKAFVAPVVLWWLAGLVHLAVQNKFYLYHALPVLAPASLLVGRVMALHAQKGIRRPLAVTCFVALPILVLVYCSQPAFPVRYANLWAFVTDRVTLQDVYRLPYYDVESDTPSGVDLDVSEYIARRTKPDDTIFVWGFEPSIYFLSERAPATRFIYNFPLYGAYPSTKLRAQFLDELERSEPVYFLVVKNDSIAHVTGTHDDSQAAFTKFSELHMFVDQHYVEETMIGDVTLYRKRGG